MLFRPLQACRAFALMCLCMVALCAVMLSSRPAAAQVQPAEASCDAVEKTESMRAAGQYREARTRLLECVNAQCGGDVRRRCAATLQKVEAVTPSIVVRAEDENGNDVTDVSVSLGPEQLVSSLDGLAIPVDPGEHAFVFQRPGEDAVTQTLSIKEGEKFRPINVRIGARPTLALPPPASEKAESSMSSARLGGTVTLIGVGAAGLAGFTWLGLNARSREHVLEDCKPGCSTGRVNSVKTRYLLANISGAVGIAALGTATWLLLSGPSENDVAQPADGLAIGASAAGAFAAYSGRF
jgi:hypothetical protein